MKSEQLEKLKVAIRSYVVRSLTLNAMPSEGMDLDFLREAMMEAGWVEKEQTDGRRRLVRFLVYLYGRTLIWSNLDKVEDDRNSFQAAPTFS
jgi:hypothetical protein